MSDKHIIIDTTVTPHRRYDVSLMVEWWRAGRTVSQIARELDLPWLLVQKGIQYFLRKIEPRKE